MAMAAALILALSLGFRAEGAPTLAGTMITNQAKVEYENLAGEAYESLSNMVVTTVLLVPGVDITSGSQTAAAPGSSAIFHHVLTNTANAPEAINLDILNASGYAYQIFHDTDLDMNLTSADAPFEDTDGDGLFDTDIMAPGASMPMFLKVEVPSDADLSTSAVFGITASSSLDPDVTDYAEDIVDVDEARPYIDVHGSPAFAYLDTEYEFKVSYGNTGDIPFAPALIESLIPDSLEFVSADGPFSYDPIAHKITWGIGSIEPGASGTFTVKVKVVSAPSGITYVENEASLSGGAAVSLRDFERTGLVTTTPSTISLVADPDTIVADGYSQSLLTATVLDILGNPVPDGTPVTFTTPSGTFLPNGLQTYTGTTTGGIATVVLVAPLIHGFEPISNVVEVKAGNPQTGEASDTVTITFSPAGVLGVVWNSDGNLPVPGVGTELLDETGAVINTAVTGADGRFMLIAPSAGLYTVRVKTSDAGHSRIVEMPVNVEELQGAIWSTPGAVLGMVFMETGAAVALDAAPSSLTPQAGVLVSLYKDGVLVLEDTTDASGEFLFTGLPFGDYVIKASTSTGLIGYSGATINQHGQVLISEFIILYESGKVYDAVNLAPIPGAQVTLLYATGPLAGTAVPLPATPSLLPQDNPAATDSLGHYIFFADPGEYVLKSTAFGYADFVSAPFVHDGTAVNAWIPMSLYESSGLAITKESSRLAAAPSETVKFTLTWSNTSGAPLPGVTLVDMLPVGVIVDAATISGAGTYDAVQHSITWNYGDVDASDAPRIESFYAAIDGAVADGTQLLNRAEVSSTSALRASASVSIIVAQKPGIEIAKVAGSSSASTGDMVTYKVNVTNSASSPTPMTAYGVEIEDTLPSGFRYVPGSTYIDGAASADPLVSGSVIRWALGDMIVGQSHEIVYKAGVGQGAVIGSDSVNYAYAYGRGEAGYPFEAGPASASVLVKGPAFSSLGAILGKLFNDKDGDGWQDKDEEGISGAEIVMDDGMRVITGEKGLYHIGQVKPGVRSLKLNMASLPYKAEMTNSFTDATGTSSSFFVDVYPSGIARQDFAVRRVEDKKDIELAMSMEVPALVSLSETATEVLVKLDLTNIGKKEITGAKVSVAGISSDPGATVKPAGEGIAEINGLMPGKASQITFKFSVSGTTEKLSSILIGAAAYIPGSGTDASEMLARASSVSVLHGYSLMKPVDGFAITAPDGVSLADIGHVGIKTTSPLSISTKLMVNGVEVPKDKVGTTTRDGKQGKLFLEYVSVEIETGENLIELIEEKTGRKVAEAVMLLPGQAVSSAIIRIPAGDGLNIGSKIAAAALVLDGSGLPAGKFVMPAFIAEGADFVGRDVKPQDEGFHTLGGERGNYDLLLTVMNPENGVKLSSEVGDHTAYADLSGLKPLDKPALVAGTIELAHFIGDFGNSYIKARAFLRKEFAGGVLTLRYDSEQGAADGMYSDASADTMYSLYGDTSILDNASPAASPFFAKFAAKGFYAMWGDFQPIYQGAELSTFKSKFTGLSIGADFAGFTLGAFAAPVQDGIKTDRIEANGTSGYFFLGEYPILTGSESVYIILTSAEDETIVLDRVALRRALDYTIDYSEGTILLNRPVQTKDEEGNRYFIEAVYTTPGTAIKGLAAGGRLRADFGAVEVGASASLSTDFADVDSALGADFVLDLGSPFRLSSEAAVSFSGGTYGGYAVKAGASSKIGKLDINIEATATDGGFVKPGESSSMPQQIALTGKLSVDKESPLILSLTSSNYWKGAGYDFSSENKLVAGYKLPLGFDLSLGMITTLAYDGASDAKGAIFDIFAESSPIPQLKITAFAQIAKLGEINDRDGDYRLAITYKPNSKVGITLGYETGLRMLDRYHTLSLSADVAVTKQGKVFGKINAPFGLSSAKVLSIGYSDAYTLAEGLKTSFLLEGAAGFTGSGIDASSTRISAAGTLKYTARNGFTASLKQEVAYDMADGFKSLTMLNLNGKPAGWLTLEGTASAYYGTSPTRQGLPLTAEASFSAALRPSNTIYTGLLKVESKYFRGESLGIDQAAVITTAVTDWTLEAGRYLSLSAKAGYKLAAEGPIGGKLATSNLMLLQGAASLHVTKTTDLEVYLRSIGWADGWKTGYSAQVVQKIFNMLSVAVGYNSEDLSDTDIVDQKPWADGFYLKLLIKF